jgi:hypothetical protein
MVVVVACGAYVGFHVGGRIGTIGIFASHKNNNKKNGKINTMTIIIANIYCIR